MQSPKIRTLHVTLSREVISKRYSPTRFVATLGRIIILLVDPEIQIYIYIYISMVIFIVGMATTIFLYPRRDTDAPQSAPLNFWVISRPSFLFP